MTFRYRAISLIVLATSVLISGCASSEAPQDLTQASADPATTATASPLPAPAPTAAPAPTSTPEPAVVATAIVEDPTTADTDPDVVIQPQSYLHRNLVETIERLSSAYRDAEGAWEGFVPEEHPVVLAVKAFNDQLLGVLAINHDAPEVLGEPVVIDTAGTPFRSIHLIVELDDQAFDTLQSLRTFSYQTQIGDSDFFAMVAGGSAAFFDSTTRPYASTLLHEMFHRYQAESFTTTFTEQDVDGYDYSATSIELIALEDHALASAIEADTDAARRLAARHLVAIRLSRLSRDDRVALDGIQEVREGTARFIEHQMAGADERYQYHENNFVEGLIDDIPLENVKTRLAFGRWYTSGAAILHLLDQLDADDVEAQIETGATPVDILASEVGFDPNEVDRLVEDARAAYDPTGELADQAQQAAEAVIDEPSFWTDDENGPAPEPTRGFREITLSEEIIACLALRGVDFSDPNLTIPREDFDECGGESASN